METADLEPALLLLRVTRELKVILCYPAVLRVVPLQRHTFDLKHNTRCIIVALAIEHEKVSNLSFS